MGGCLQHTEENRDFEQEWDNITNRLRETAEEKLANIKVIHNRRY